MRRAARADGNQVQIVKAFERLGFAVLHLHRVGDGCPDILVSWGGEPMDPGTRMYTLKGINVLVEIKTETGKLEKAQSRFFAEWPGPKAVVRNVSDVECIVNCIRSGAWLRYVS